MNLLPPLTVVNWLWFLIFGYFYLSVFQNKYQSYKYERNTAGNSALSNVEWQREGDGKVENHENPLSSIWLLNWLWFLIFGYFYLSVFQKKISKLQIWKKYSREICYVRGCVIHCGRAALKLVYQRHPWYVRHMRVRYVSHMTVWYVRYTRVY